MRLNSINARNSTSERELAVPKFSRELRRVSNFNKSIKWHHHIKGHVEIGNLIKYMMLLGWTETKLWTLKYGSKSIQTSLILTLFKMGKHSDFYLCFFQMVGAWWYFTVFIKLIENFKGLYGFVGCCLKIRDVCMDFEPYFKVHNLVSVHLKSITLDQIDETTSSTSYQLCLFSFLSNVRFRMKFWERFIEIWEYGLFEWGGVFLFGIVIPMLREVIRIIVHTRKYGSNFPQFLISDPWNNGQFG